VDVENTSRNSQGGAGAGGTAAALPRWLTGVIITAIAATTLAALLAPWLRSQQAPSPSGPQVVAVIFGDAAAGAGVRLGSSAPNFLSPTIKVLSANVFDARSGISIH